MGDRMIHCRELRKSFDTKQGRIDVISNLSFDVHEQEFVTIFGPNGCGKSTLMNILCGLESIDGGVIEGLPQLTGAIGFVFQDYRRSLLPWASVRENICFPLKLRGVAKSERRALLDELMGEVEISLDLNRSVKNLSGGQAQLVAVLRALIVRPKLFILDEPFAALDYERTRYLRSVVMRLALKFKLTTILISHDIDDALFLGDKVLFLTKAPSRARQVLPVPFERPRDEAILVDPRFIDLKRTALGIFSECLHPVTSGPLPSATP